ncbi:MAG: hypothetical protein GW795_05955 [Cyanobacteria bacterium]|nr:hypothetical protein [Cyanobacteria bacterium CG_2015-16_32_12]NCO78675.1 hypothetical protein [Cyanobacteria bacterium CG_2015-22_32_23]NCQ05448.1 hypothetical protein [Cyanobacteria bacterium CG_2015-09_32_10]NCQ41430.1 hypothetical protein [Cyanobacteria bacterium CG_2015-04_32_10]NCS85734.1 hypothetical protein [Cyanobacteria bacterium CG_2015-02_32_10]
MIDFIEILNNAVNDKNSLPKSNLLVEALLAAEKYSHQEKTQYQFEQLIGHWQLHFITGTKNSQKKLGNFLGSGFYLPSLVKVIISYSSEENLKEKNQGKIENIVKFGLVKFIIDGPSKFILKKNIIAFDFTYLKMFILGQKTYEMNIRNGKDSHSQFYQKNINQQAFFSYFYVSENIIAARGRGGGLALWKKVMDK